MRATLGFPRARRLAACALTLASVLRAVPQTLAGQPVPALPAERIVFAPDDTKRCLKCHGMANFAFRDSLTLALHNYTVSADTFQSSVHRNVACQQCHPEIKQYPHPFAPARPKVSCGTDCHAHDSLGNVYTHGAVLAEFRSSVHARGLTGENPDSPTCTTCHGTGNPHGVMPAQRRLSPQTKMALCAACHDDAPRMVRNKVNPGAVSSYRRSFHYKAIRFGQTNTAVCQDCHTVHHVLPKDSVGSSIAPAHIAGTCGQQQCHPGARLNFAMSGANHLDLKIEEAPLLGYLEKFFVLLTGGTMAMLVAGIILDIQRKFGWLFLLGTGLRRLASLLAAASRIGRPILRFGRKVLID